ncbi:hypothetical protein XaC1_9 [Xanthomonas phage XaC1]|nr:hypothetical protein XaC1_9 [Xanthomonas phage XaC1]
MTIHLIAVIDSNGAGALVTFESSSSDYEEVQEQLENWLSDEGYDSTYIIIDDIQSSKRVVNGL